MYKPCVAFKQTTDVSGKAWHTTNNSANVPSLRQCQRQQQLQTNSQRKAAKLPVLECNYRLTPDGWTACLAVAPGKRWSYSANVHTAPDAQSWVSGGQRPASVYFRSPYTCSNNAHLLKTVIKLGNASNLRHKAPIATHTLTCLRPASVQFSAKRVKRE